MGHDTLRSERGSTRRRQPLPVGGRTPPSIAADGAFDEAQSRHELMPRCSRPAAERATVHADGRTFVSCAVGPCATFSAGSIPRLATSSRQPQLLRKALVEGQAPERAPVRYQLPMAATPAAARMMRYDVPESHETSYPPQAQQTGGSVSTPEVGSTSTPTTSAAKKAATTASALRLGVLTPRRMPDGSPAGRPQLPRSGSPQVTRCTSTRGMAECGR